MAKQVTINDSKSFIPSSFDTVNSSYASNYNDGNTAVDGIYSGNVISNGFTDENSSTRAALYTNTGSSAASYIYYNFDCSSIPSKASINSVSCVVKVGTQGTNYYNTRQVQLCTGTTPKGSPVTASGTNTSPSSHTLNVSDFTRNELSDVKVRLYVTRISGSGNYATDPSTVSFYGATLTVNYTYQGTVYEITSISNTDLVESIDPEGTTDVMSGDSYTLNVYADTFGGFIVEDNGIDVTNQLVQKESINTGSSSTVLGTYTLVSGGFSSGGANYFQGLVGKGVDGSQTTSNYYSNGNGTIAVFTYNLSFSNIPSNATITRLYCQVNGHAESTSNNNEYMCAQLRTGNTELSNELNFKSIGTSNSTQTIEATTLPTVAQLENLVLYCRLGYYGGAINGATCYIEYTLPSTSEYYWEYTLSNVSADHTIYVTEAVVIPPDEDPTKEYYPITISSINATTTPDKGTTRVESGTSETITITPSDPQLTLALDNGVDITSQLVQHGGTIPDPTINTASGASYGFNLNSSTGYYVSQNTGIDKSAAVARVLFNLPVRCLVTINFINYAEASYDFGVFGNIDTSLNTNYYAAGRGGATITDTSYKLACNNSSYNTSSVQSLTYEIESGEHYIDIKYSKDDATGSNNDSLQWKITSIEPLESVVGYYTYDLSNISQEHSLIFIFGDVTYYFVNSSTNSDCTLYPNGQMVQLPGDSYRLTIVPKNNSDSITLRDNNVDVTSQLERKEVTTEKDGQTITVVNYIYRLSNIQATHNLVVSSASQGLIPSIKLNGQWNEGELKRKQDDRWGTLSYTRIWVNNGSAWIENAQRTITTNGMIFGGVINNGGGE